MYISMYVYVYLCIYIYVYVYHMFSNKIGPLIIFYIHLFMDKTTY